MKNQKSPPKIPFSTNPLFPLLLVLVNSLNALAQTPTKYTITSNDVSVNSEGIILSCSYNYAIKNIIIPAEFADGTKITGIDKKVFSNIGLTGVELTEGLLTIADSAFYNNSLTGTLTLPASIKTIGRYAFKSNNYSVVTFQPLSSIEFIDEYAFYDNAMLQSIILPSRNANDAKFEEYRDGNVTSYAVGDSFNNFQIFYRVYRGTYTLTESDMLIYNHLLFAVLYSFEIKDIIIPDEVAGEKFKITTIGHSFAGEGITSIQLPEGIKLLTKGAFENNRISGNLTLPASLTEIRDGAFQNNNLQSVTFAPNSKIELIRRDVFSQNPHLQSVTLPASHADDISVKVNYQDNKGNKYDAGGSITDFSLLYTSYKGQYTLQASDVTVSPEGVITACNYNFAIKDIIIPDNINGIDIKGIGEGVFTKKWLTSVVLPQKLQTIGVGAFSENFIGGSLVLPDSLKTIRGSAFFSNLLYGTLIIPDSVATIERGAFSANNFSEIIFNPTSKIKKILGRAFVENPLLLSITLPSRSKANYRFYWGQRKYAEYEDIGLSPVISNFDFDFEAFFVKQISVSAEVIGGGGIVTVSPEPNDLGTYDSGTNITFTAIRDNGYRFVKWTGLGTYNKIKFSLKVLDDAVLKAFFSKQVTLKINSASKNDPLFHAIWQGNVSAEPSANIGLRTYDINTEVRLLAEAGLGYRFEKWIVGETRYDADLKLPTLVETQYDTNEKLIALDYDTEATAYFIKQVTFYLDEVTPEKGTVTSTLPSGSYDINTKVTLTASPSKNYRFDRWSVGTMSYPNLTQEITLVDNSTIATPFLVKQATLILPQVLVGGTVSLTPKPNSGVGTYDIGTEVAITATPSSGYRLDRVEVGPHTFYSFTKPMISLSKDTTVSVYFAKQVTLILTPALEEEGTLVVTPESNIGIETYDQGTIVTFNATPKSGYRVEKWAIGGLEYPNGQKITLTADVTATAYFARIEQVTFEFAQFSTEQGTVSVAPPLSKNRTTYDIGTVLTLTATPSDGYEFEKWVVGTQPFTNNPQKITLTANATLTVYFKVLTIEEPFVLAVDGPENSTINYYPNPVSDILTVKTHGLESVTLLSIDGRVVQHSSPDSTEKLQIDVSALKTGIYLIKLTHADGHITTAKVLKH